MTAVPIPAELVGDQPEWANELDEAIAAGAEVPEPVRPWVPTSEGEAEWAARKLAVLLGRAREVREQATAWHARITEWADGELGRVLPGVTFFDRRLQEYGLAQRATNPKRATIPLPSAVIATTMPKTPTVELVDEDAFAKWALDFLDGAVYEAVTSTKVHALISEIRKIVEVKPGPIVCNDCLGEIVHVDDGDGWRHVDVDNECAGVEPVPTFVVMMPGTGERIPGLVAGLKPPHASVTVAP